MDDGEAHGAARRGPSILSLLLMTLAMLVVFPLFAWFGLHRHGSQGLVAAGVASGVCWVGSTGALLMALIFRRSDNSLPALMLGMILRMGLPLGAVVFFTVQKHALVDSGVIGMILVYYLFALVVETALSLRLVVKPGRVTKAT